MFSKWVEVTSLNGGIDWYQSRDKKSHFTFWTVVMMTMIACSIVFTYRTIQDYVNQPTITTTTNVQNASLEIPEVLICFNGGLNMKKMRDKGFSEEFIINFIGNMRTETGNVSLLEILHKELMEFLQKHDMNMRDFYGIFSYACQDILIKTNLESFIGKKYCQDVTNLYSNTFGKCQLFEKNVPQNYPGIDGGFALDLKVPPDSFYEYYPFLAAEKSYSNSFSISLDQHFRWITRRWLLAPSNMRTEITLRTSRYLRLASSNPCDSAENTYSSNTCFHRCYAEAYYKYCNCSLLEYLDSPDEHNYPHICTSVEPNCTAYDMEWAQPCNTQCRRKCKEWVYDSSVSYGALEQKSINSSVAYVSVGYNTMSYMQV